MICALPETHRDRVTGHDVGHEEEHERHAEEHRNELQQPACDELEHLRAFGLEVRSRVGAAGPLRGPPPPSMTLIAGDGSLLRCCARRASTVSKSARPIALYVKVVAPDLKPTWWCL